MRRMSRHAGWKEIDRLFEAGTLVGLTDRQLLERYLGGEAAEAALRGPGGTSRADGAGRLPFDARTIGMRPMTRSRRRSWCWPDGPARSDGGTPWGAGYTGSRAGSRRRARADAARRGMLAALPRSSGHASSRPGRDPRASRCPSCWKRSSGCPSAIGRRWCSAIWRAGRHDQAARILGCPMRTIETRLQRGKAKLRTRLVRRGLAPAAGLLAIGVERRGTGRIDPGGVDRIDGSGIVAIRRRPRRRARLDRRWPGPGRHADTILGPAPAHGGAGCSHYLWVWPWPSLAIAAAAQKPDQAGANDRRPDPRREGPSDPRRRSVAAGRRRRS